MRLIIVAGMPGSGKEEFLKVADGMGIPFLRMGDIVREAYPDRNAACKDMSIGEFAESERKDHGYDIWAKRSLERMSGNIFLIDGCRSTDEVKAFRSLTDDVVVVAVHSSPSSRYSRLVERNRNDAPSGIREFEDRDEREIRWGLAKTIALADVLITNGSTLDEFRKESVNVLNRLRA